MKKESDFINNFKPNLNSIFTIEESFKNIIFYDKDHTYKIDDVLVKNSVTQLISKYVKKFDAPKIAQKIADKEGVDVKDVLESWNYLRDYANHKGTEFHNFVENYLTRKRLVINQKEIVNFYKNRMDFYKEESIDLYYKEFASLVKGFLNFYENEYKSNYLLVKKEFIIGDKDWKIAGTLDNLSFNKNIEELEILDYKTNAKFKETNEYGENLLSPLDHLENNDINKYSLQLWIYKLILEKNLPYSIGDCYIIRFCDKKYKKYKALDLRKEANIILNS
jgi:hypothetical protein